MVSIKGNDISLTRGDTLFLTVALQNQDGTPYSPQTGDSLRFAMKKSYTSQDLLILKQIPMETLTLEIEPSDTKPLKFAAYVYDIELTDGAGHVFTPISGYFNVTEEVH